MTAQKRVFQTDSFTRGGQIFSHEWRMRLQNFKLVFFLSLPFLMFGLWVSIIFYKTTFWYLFDFYTVSYLGGHLKIIIWKTLQPLLLWFDQQTGSGASWARMDYTHLITELRFPKGGILKLKTIDFLKNNWVLHTVALLKRPVVMTITLWVSGNILIYMALSAKSKRLEDQKLMKGLTVVSEKTLSRLLKNKKRASWLRLGKMLPFVKNAETQHVLVVGTTGSGKTNCILGLLQQIQDKNQPVVVLDTNCTLVNRYYNEKRGDIILNPFDKRSVRWDLWQDCKETPDFDAFASALIPEPSFTNNPVWHKNAREIIATTAEKLSLSGNPSMRDLIDYAAWKALAEVKHFYKNTPLESLMIAEGRAEETVHSIRMQMTDSMKRLALLPQEGENFSIGNWVKNHKKGAWLFISCSEKDRFTLGPLMKLWVAIAIQNLLRRGENPDYRLWFILDELFSLEGGTVANLITLLSEGRKYGGCALLAFQSLAGLERTYGFAGMKEILSLCNTKVVLRTPEPQNAAYLSQLLGEKEILEAAESLSMGAHHMRD
ncbi:MAG: type IV secretion system DNA-binding domain-containing protein, partial [Silvanigrellaceae bacterium]|nr:type IV secretion system DNA-binding domain-containing protein [Silvanigrellaceae bacterium]